MEHKISTEKKMRYVVKDFTTGLTDLKLKARMPDGTLFDFGGGETELVLTEISNGEYEGTYTPNALGIWQELITSVTNEDKAIRSYIVVAIDLTSIKTVVDDIHTDLVDIHTGIADVHTDVGSVITKVDGIHTDVGTAISKIDALDLQISPGGYFSN